MPITTLSHLIDWSALSMLEGDDFRDAARQCLKEYNEHRELPIEYGYSQMKRKPTIADMKLALGTWVSEIVRTSLLADVARQVRITAAVHRLGRGTHGLAEVLIYELLVANILGTLDDRVLVGSTATVAHSDNVKVDLSGLDQWVVAMVLRKEVG